MELIPVIDLKGGEVVRAERGARHLYAPIRTPLSPTSHPVDVVAGFLALHDFRTIYIADIDAIEGAGDHSAAIGALETEFPSVSFWVDPGIVDLPQTLAFFERHRGDLVLGSESLRDITTLTALSRQPALATRSVLSLDFRDDTYQGPDGLNDEPVLWPQRLIVMTLARVGSNTGPDLDRLRSVAAKAGKQRAVYAAGGVRGPEDLAALAEARVQGVLIASALHDGRLDAEVIERFQSAKL